MFILKNTASGAIFLPAATVKCVWNSSVLGNTLIHCFCKELQENVCMLGYFMSEC